MSYSISSLSSNQVNKSVDKIDKSYYPFFEYANISEKSLSENYKELLSSYLLEEGSIAKLIEKNGQQKGLIVLQKNEFDSDVFGYNIYNPRLCRTIFRIERSADNLQFPDDSIFY